MPQTATVRERHERLRLDLVEVHRTCRRLVEEHPPARNKALFHCGAHDALEPFKVFLAAEDAEFQQAQSLEDLPAGQFLARETARLREHWFPAPDWNATRKFELPDGGEFGASIAGFWRDLSARYARACSGVVNALVSTERAHVHRQGLELWAKGQRHPGYLNALRVFGFVEFPILVGALSRNAGVTEVRLYRGSPGGGFERLDPPPVICYRDPG